MIYLGTADNRAVVFGMIKSSCGHWYDVIGVGAQITTEKGKGDFERRNNSGSYRERDTIGRSCVDTRVDFDGMIQGRADGGQCCDQALIPHVPRKHAKSARLIAHSVLGSVRLNCLICRCLQIPVCATGENVRLFAR